MRLNSFQKQQIGEIFDTTGQISVVDTPSGGLKIQVKLSDRDGNLIRGIGALFPGGEITRVSAYPENGYRVQIRWTWRKAEFVLVSLQKYVFGKRKLVEAALELAPLIHAERTEASIQRIAELRAKISELTTV